MKLKVIPIVLALVGSSGILFGGWFVYHSVAMENPLNQVLNGAAGVEQSEASVSGDKVLFDLKLSQQANLREIVHQIEKESSSVTGNRELEFNVESNTSPALEDWWSRALFDVAQAMETKKYSDIPASLENKAGQTQGLTVETEMDEKNVYVRMAEGEHVKFVILPRNPAKMGVWPNE